MRMIEIDGSHGEGGGQILRTSIALAAVTGEQVRIGNIRAGRPVPGLQPQHLTSIEAVAEICGAEVDGLFKGSKEVVFRPGPLLGGDFEFDVGTAGSVCLVITSCLLPGLFSKARLRLTVRGGTDVRWSPPIDYLRLIHLPILNEFGGTCGTELVSRGFFPEGGGEVFAEISPAGGLSRVRLTSRGRTVRIEGVAYAQNLPEHVITRMKHSALKRLLEFKEVKIESDLRKGRSTGAGIVLSAVCENTVLGQSALGAKGVRSETLGEECADDLLETLRSGATVDEHMLDQILLYMAFAEEGSEVVAEELTPHAETNIWVIERFLGRKFSIESKDGLVTIRAN
jgi:RNA 3'-terminal phosphate cyclase (ATP)